MMDILISLWAGGMAAVPEIQALINRDFPPDSHPYRILEKIILDHVDPGCTVLDIGCGRRAPNLLQLKGRARTLIGIDLVDFELEDAELLLVNADACDMAPVPSGSVDLAYSRSVMEHIKNVRAAYSEINRVLKPGGKYIFLTPSAWDYASIIAYLVPNRFHGKITRVAEGRQATEVFPTYYQSNTFRKISKMAAASNFSVEHFEYLGPVSLLFRFQQTLVLHRISL